MRLKKLFKIIKRVFGIKRQRVRKRKKRSLYKKSKRHHLRCPQRKQTKRIPRKKINKRSARPARKKKKTAVKAVEVGIITHYFPHVRAAVVKLKKPLQVGQPVWIHGKTTDFRQTVSSLQIDRKPIDHARAGQEIGLEVCREVRPQDKIYRLS